MSNGTLFPLANYGRQIVGGAPLARDDAGNQGKMNAFTAWRQNHIEEQDSTTTYAHTEISRTYNTFVTDWMHE